MASDSLDLPNLEWPEHYRAGDGNEIVRKIVDLLRAHYGLDLRSPGIVMVFVPDPPESGESKQWIREQVEAGDELELASLSWGRHGLAYVSSSTEYFGKLIAAALSMGSTTLSILAVRKNDTVDLSAPRLSALIESFMADRPATDALLEYGGLFFDMGVLRSMSGSAC